LAQEIAVKLLALTYDSYTNFERFTSASPEKSWVDLNWIAVDYCSSISNSQPRILLHSTLHIWDYSDRVQGTWYASEHQSSDCVHSEAIKQDNSTSC